MIEIAITGRDAMLARYLGRSVAVRQAVNRSVETLTEEMADKVREKVSVYSRSGRMLESVSTVINYFTPATISGRVFYDLGKAPYAAIQEEGGRTRPHAIVAHGNALRFMGREGAAVFRGMVNHPGATIPAKNSMSQTFAENRAYIIAELRGAARSAM